MNNDKSKSAWKRITAGLAFVALLGMGQSAWAAGSVAADHIIRNTVTVNYEDLNSSSFSDTDTVDITVDLVEAAPDVFLSLTQTDSFNPVSFNESVNVIWTVTSNANGSDLYNLTESTSIISGSLGGATFSSVTDYTLGGTTAAAAVTSFETANVGPTGTNTLIGTDILVPADLLATGALNDLAAGDLVFLDATTGTKNVCTILEVKKTVGDQANLNATLEVHQCSNGGSTNGGDTQLAIGDQIGERQDITITFTAGNTALVIDVFADVDFDGGVSANTSAFAQTITIVAANLDVYKFVRNDTTPATGLSDQDFDVLTFDSKTYYARGITAAPGEVLEYAILLLNKAGAVQDVVTTDPAIPFTKYSDRATGFGIHLYEEETVVDLTCETPANTCVVNTVGTDIQNADDDIGGGGTLNDHGGLDGTTITVYAGVGGDEQTPVGGTIAAGKVSVILYRLSVDN